MAGESKTTADHKVIKRWAEARGGKPATVKSTGGKHDAGVLRIEFPGHGSDDNLKVITWEEFFEKFSEKKLVMLYQEKTADGSESRFCKFVTQETAHDVHAKSHHSEHKEHEAHHSESKTHKQ